MRTWLRAIAVAMALLLMPMAVHAGVDYCQSDPIVDINGIRHNILVGIPYSALGHINGPVSVTIQYPSGVPAEIIFVDQSMFRQEVKLQTSGKWKSGGGNVMRVLVDIPTPRSAPTFPVQLTITNSSGTTVVNSYSNSQVIGMRQID